MNNLRTYIGDHPIKSFGAAQLLFLFFKLTGIVNWSWFWVLLPTWAALGFGIFILAFFVHLMMKYT